MSTAVAFAKQDVMAEASDLIKQIDDRDLRFYFTPYLDAAQSGLHFPAGLVCRVDPVYKSFRPDELELTGRYKREDVKVSIYGNSELWTITEQPGVVMQSLLLNAEKQEAGAREITALAKYRFDVGFLNQWLFNVGHSTLADLRAGLEQATGERYRAIGFPTESAAVDVFMMAQRQVIEAVNQAERFARSQYQNYLSMYKTAQAGNGNMQWHDSAHYRRVLRWLGEVDVVEASEARLATMQANAGNDALAQLGNTLAQSLERGMAAGIVAASAATATATATATAAKLKGAKISE